MHNVLSQYNNLNQISGHGNILFGKKFIVKPTNKRELWFYKIINNSVNIPYKQYMPKLYGSLNKNNIILENLLYTFTYPCIIDIKLGIRSWGDNASKDKIKRGQMKIIKTTSLALGFRISGFKYISFNDSKFNYMSKKEAKSIQSNNISNIFINFFQWKNNKQILFNIYAKLCRLYEDLKSQHKFRIYGSSLLIIYDYYNINKTDIKLIDFAHTYVLTSQQNQDDGYIFGLKSILKILTQIMNGKS